MCGKFNKDDFSIHWNALPILFYGFCIIIFYMPLYSLLIFLNPHTPTLAKGVFVLAGPRQFSTQSAPKESSTLVSKYTTHIASTHGFHTQLIHPSPHTHFPNSTHTVPFSSLISTHLSLRHKRNLVCIADAQPSLQNKYGIFVGPDSNSQTAKR